MLVELENIIDRYSSEIIEKTQKLVSFESILQEGEVPPFGEGILRALHYVLDLGDRLGFRVQNFHNYAGIIEYGEGDEYVGILCHLDVVPAGGQWKHPPFAGIIEDGKIFGRGTLDNKGPIIASLYGLKALKELGVTGEKKVRIILGTDEETRCRGLQYYLSKEPPPIYGFSPDAEFPIIYAEKGILHFDLEKDLPPSVQGLFLEGGKRVNVVPDTATLTIHSSLVSKEKLSTLKEYDWITVDEEAEGLVITTQGTSSHASTPGKGVNAIQRLLWVCCELALEEVPELTYLSSMDTRGEFLGIAGSDDISGELTLNAGIIELFSGKLRVSFDVRYPVSWDLNPIQEKIQETIKGYGFKYREVHHKRPLYVAPDTSLIKRLQEAYEEVTKEKAYLLSIGGGTYSRYLENTVAFGPVFPGDEMMAHEANEYIEIPKLLLMTKIYAWAIYRLMQ